MPDGRRPGGQRAQDPIVIQPRIESGLGLFVRLSTGPPNTPRSYDMPIRVRRALLLDGKEISGVLTFPKAEFS